MIIEFTDRTKVNVDKYREFYQLINKYYSAEVGENDSERTSYNNEEGLSSNLTLLDSATNREYKDAPICIQKVLYFEI